MKLTFAGGARTVTGANYLLETAESKVLIDCGLNQGSRVCEAENYNPFPYDPSTINALFITHAHIDHVGRAPRLYKMGFRGDVFSTEPTKEFAEELLRDSQDLLSREAKAAGRDILYDDKDIDEFLGLWKTNGYHKEILLRDLKITFFDAGHILGSASILVETEGKRIIFSGDIGNSPAPLVKSPEKLQGMDYALIESAYGGRLHEDKAERKQILEDVIEETVKRGGTLMIPAFAMERTQELLYELNNLVEAGRIPHIPIFLDSPLAIKLTSIYNKYANNAEYINRESMDLFKAGDSIFRFPGLEFVLKTEDSKKIVERSGPKIIIAGSGMSNGGRIVRHEAHYLKDEKNTLLIIGYQAKGSLGRAILDGAKSVKIVGEDVPVRAQIQAIGGYSSHADQSELLNWLRPMRDTLKNVFIVQGEEDQMDILQTAIRDKLAVDASIPHIGDSIGL
ncbi:hypothetical protein A3A64_04275 [Candidatus Gottesmanbacteria bacterium RIFCSPLOWO2_01_FULL_48_11]|uniref:MBL fold hydrolase n=3 Tax=Patescibacteria group TaxID=1783273 RepID=A0A1F6ATH5_9BACT|nr:MAG: Beta-lactamase domain protein [Parcubacteria group bacterium GW2011_GWA2_46_10]KKU22309.1 MAG: Beta-lactamase domain protein [Candidatus Nomurabacteria bacterium GW2011_GWA1_46_11]OGG28005.1 MAG: hypothetical protein A3A64_04275 [Candidatus Gottesmanbacteria bacterium RIFCSPLOWO2_01_FULL_48_11]OGY56276.1 MAG: hypothetical protein A2119_00545 [Candidatus Colwellbacteria bacterium GWA2_46_10]